LRLAVTLFGLAEEIGGNQVVGGGTAMRGGAVFHIGSISAVVRSVGLVDKFAERALQF
jgi:hypothetical protein